MSFWIPRKVDAYQQGIGRNKYPALADLPFIF